MYEYLVNDYVDRHVPGHCIFTMFKFHTGPDWTNFKIYYTFIRIQTYSQIVSRKTLTIISSVVKILITFVSKIVCQSKTNIPKMQNIRKLREWKYNILLMKNHLQLAEAYIRINYNWVVSLTFTYNSTIKGVQNNI